LRSELPTIANLARKSYWVLSQSAVICAPLGFDSVHRQQAARLLEHVLDTPANLVVSDSELHGSLGHQEPHPGFLRGTIRVDAVHCADARQFSSSTSLLIVNDGFRVDSLRLRLPGVGRYG
jgi:hypothetical protein